MKKIILSLLILIPVIGNAGRRQVIFDTDWWTDVDDACAIRLLLDAQREGTVDLKGICLSAVRPTSIPSLASFLRSEGAPEIALGADFQATDFNGTPCYHQLLIDAVEAPVPECEDCVDFYRRILSECRGKLDIIAVGYPNALARLLESGPDEHSRLDGRRLVRRKVRHLWMMAGNYPSGKENNFSRTSRSVSAGMKICSGWPGRITFLGHEVGIQVVAGGALADNDLLHKVLAAHGSAAGRYAWDPLTVLLALGYDGFAETRGTNSVIADDGTNEFSESRHGRHGYVSLTMPPQQHAERLDSLLY